LKAALMSGITGQDGAYLAQFLSAKNYKIYGCINPAVPYGLNNLNFLEIERSIELIPVNLLDVAAVNRLLEKVQPNEIYHLAAQSSVGLSFEQPALTMEFNVLSTLKLLEAIRTSSLNTRFFHPSSADMYGKVQKLPVTEQTCPRPVSP
jgi:GDPmannose 4,6-dehydratase